jgi:hypothetical protein
MRALIRFARAQAGNSGTHLAPRAPLHIVRGRAWRVIRTYDVGWYPPFDCTTTHEMHEFARRVVARPTDAPSHRLPLAPAARRGREGPCGP